MRFLDWLNRLLGGNLSKLEAQHAAQQVELIPLPSELTFAGRKVTVRPMERGDRDAILAFARALPEHDLLFLRRDITDPENVDEWLRELAEGRYSTLVAVGADARVLGYATVASDGMTWTRHVAELRLLLAPEMRGQGLGRLLTEQSFAMARERGIEKMLAQMTTDQRAAIHTFERMGFEREAILRSQVMDRDGALHDLQIMALDTRRFGARLAVARNLVERQGPPA